MISGFPAMNFILMLQILSCWFMVGVIWLVQILVYPSFRLVTESEIKKIHEFHTTRIIFVVGPMMAVELATAMWLFWYGDHGIYSLNLVSVIALWLLTGLISVPLHNRIPLNQEVTKNWLTWSNWARTAIWSLGSLMWLWFISQRMAEIHL